MKSHTIGNGITEIASPGARYLRLKSAIQYFEMSYGELRRLLSAGTIPGFRHSGRLYVDIRDIDVYVERAKAERARDLKQVKV